MTIWIWQKPKGLFLNEKQMFKDTVKIMGLWRKLAMTPKLQEDFLNIFHIQDSAKKKKEE